MGITIVGAGISGMLAAFRLVNDGKSVTLIEKGRSITERIKEIEENSVYSPYGYGGRIFFNFKPFKIDKTKKDLLLTELLKSFDIYPEDNIVTIKIMIDLIKELHKFLSQKAKLYYETEVVGFIENYSKLSGVKLSNDEIIYDDNFLFSFGTVNRLTYKKVLDKGGVISSLSAHLPLKVSLKLDNSKEFKMWNDFIESKPFFSYRKHLFFIDEYQKNTKIIPIETDKHLISYENLSYNSTDDSTINFNLNISLSQNNLSGFGTKTLKNFAFLSLIEANQKEVNDKVLITLDEFMKDNIYDSILTPWLTESFRVAFRYFFADLNYPFEKIKIHGISTISLRPVQLTTDSEGRFLTYPNVKIVGNARKDYGSLKEKIIETLNYNLF